VFAEWYDLNRGASDFFEKLVQGRALQQNLPSGARRLTEYDVRKAFSFRKRGEAVCGPVRLHANDRGAKVFSQSDVPLQRAAILRLDVVRRLTGRLDIDSVPTGTQATGQTCAGTEDARCVRR